MVPQKVLDLGPHRRAIIDGDGWDARERQRDATGSYGRKLLAELTDPLGTDEIRHGASNDDGAIDGLWRYPVVDYVVSPLALFVVLELAAVCRRYAMPVLVGWMILLGLALGFATDFLLGALGA